jgi:hypothetical protein
MRRRFRSRRTVSMDTPRRLAASPSVISSGRNVGAVIMPLSG